MFQHTQPPPLKKSNHTLRKKPKAIAIPRAQPFSSVKLSIWLLILGLLYACTLYTLADPQKIETNTNQANNSYTESYDILSTHHTVATYKGISHHPCRFLTAQCPDKCDHAGDKATFEINQYTHYLKPGKYGDAKSDTFSIMLKPKYLPQETIQYIRDLSPGTKLTLHWQHRYITRVFDGEFTSKFPLRTITKISPIEND